MTSPEGPTPIDSQPLTTANAAPPRIDDASVLDADEDEEEAPRSNDGELELALAELAARCSTAGIETAPAETGDGSPMLFLFVPAGRDTRRLVVRSAEHVRDLLELPIERHRYIAHYEAIVNYEDRFIEAAVQALGSSYFSFLRRLGTDGEIALTDPHHQGCEIRLAPSTPALDSMVRDPLVRSRAFSLQLRGFAAKTHEQAATLLENVANSVFFTIDRLYGGGLMLMRPRDDRRRLLARRSYGEDPLAIEFPRAIFNPQAMSSYWYARSAPTMPLLQYLAYYQAIESFFPRFSKQRAVHQIQTILKDPVFSAHREPDIVRLVNAMQAVGVVGGGNERQQLEATIAGCISELELGQFVAAESSREEFLRSDQSLARTRIRLKQPQGTVAVADVAARIYEIRCRIVHAKDESGARIPDLPPLVPFSNEQRLLRHDLALVDLLCARVLSATSTPFEVG
jgi:hypothetical protein